MEQIVDKLINMGMEQFMNDSRQNLIMADEVYLNDIKDEAELEQKYMHLDLSSIQKMISDDYIACIRTACSRYADISYMAGIKDAAKMFMYLGLLRYSEDSDCIIDTELKCKK